MVPRLRTRHRVNRRGHIRPRRSVALPAIVWLTTVVYLLSLNSNSAPGCLETVVDIRQVEEVWRLEDMRVQVVRDSQITHTGRTCGY